MNIADVSLPEIYKSSMDFRFFIRWAELALLRIQEDTENFIDLYDPLRCPADLLWLLADTMGFKLDKRLTHAGNRFILLYFMDMIRRKGSRDGVTLAAEANLAQLNIKQYSEESEILENRLEDTALPVNAVYVESHPGEGYIDVVYFSDTIPDDACIEYVRPLGMYLSQHAGVRFDSRTHLTIDSRLLNPTEMTTVNSLPTVVGHYTRNDYASLQRSGLNQNEAGQTPADGREDGWFRNSEAEGAATEDAGHRALHNLQLSNNDHIVRSLLSPIFELGYRLDSDDRTGESIQADPTGVNNFANLMYHVDVDVENTGTYHTVYTDPEDAATPTPPVDDIQH